MAINQIQPIVVQGPSFATQRTRLSTTLPCLWAILTLSGSSKTHGAKTGASTVTHTSQEIPPKIAASEPNFTQPAQQPQTVQSPTANNARTSPPVLNAKLEDTSPTTPPQGFILVNCVQQQIARHATIIQELVNGVIKGFR